MAPPSRKPNVVIETRIRSVSSHSFDDDVDELAIRSRKRGPGLTDSERSPKRPKKKKKKKTHSPVVHDEACAEIDVHATLPPVSEQPGVQEGTENMSEDVALKVNLKVFSRREPRCELQT